MRRPQPAGVPWAVRRVLRDRARASGIVLVALALLAASGVRTGATASLQATLDENWRGAYDLLVTAPGTSTEVAGLLSPTAITSLSQRMSIDDVAAVRAVAGVEVAAPIGEAVLSASFPGRVRFAIPIATGRTTPQPVAYRATLTWTTSDGLGERVVAHDTVVLAIDDADLPEIAVQPASDFGPDDTCTVDGVVLPVAENEICRTWPRRAVQVKTGDGWYSTFDIVDGYLTFAFEGEPALSPHVVLVDPVAEQALLGDAGAFLQPLVEDVGLGTAGELGVSGVDGSVPTIPFLVADDVGLPLSVTVEVETGFGDVTDGGQFSSWVLPPDVETGPGRPVGSATYDVSTLLRPLTGDPVYVTWPGAPELVTSPTAPTWLAVIAGSISTGDLPVAPTGNAATAPETLSVTADRFVDAVMPMRRPQDQLVFPAADGTVPGRESVFRRLGRTVTPESVGSQELPYAIAVGTFDPSAVTPDDSGLGYVPVGGIDPVGSTLVAGADGEAIAPVDLEPSLSGFGIANAIPAAIGDIARAPEWGMREPVSAIRVRVAGVDGYTDEGRAAVLDVAHRIANLGYTVTLAAGSSREDVTLHVDGYAFGTADPDVPQRVGVLGDVAQRWPRLGAAVAVEGAVTAATTAALWLAVIGSTLLLGAAQAVAVPARRRDAAILGAAGWRRRDIARWFAAEEVVGLAVVAIAAASAAALTWTQRLGGSAVGVVVAIGAGVAAVVATSLLGLLASLRPPRRRRARGRRPHLLHIARGPLRSARGFGVGQARRHPAHAATMATATVVVALGASALVAVVQAGVTAAGRTDLGLFAAARGTTYQAATGVVGLLSGLLLMRLAQRTDARVRAGQWEALRGMGWTGRDTARARAAELALVLAPAIALACAAVWAASAQLGAGDPPQLAAVAAATGGIAAVALLVGARRRGRHHER